MSPRTEQAERTREALIASARVLFADKGFFATGTTEIVEHANVTRGALYHHFARKDDLFRAVFHAVQSDLFARSALGDEGVGSGERWKKLRNDLIGFLSAATLPEVQRILLQDGPAVLGWTEWRGLEAHYGLGVIKKAVEDGIVTGLIRNQPIEPLSMLILAVIDEAALFVTNSTDPTQAIATTTTAIDTLLSNLG